ncbi:hypothetical protein Mgra_00005364 [Meloidogyne graminicola]|uniref:tRNA (adenine(58)-N(1))-methyltransferase non-catalytic subunit TRM6 n=1 Tax=Meloidogyne graminicola TaxID=189291 RepID=A0A8S9ZQ31_9BILA|nr:hypothetical protein Mgra_00005364 [Meloidogyne graminicola]
MEEIKNDSLICNRDYAIIQKIGGMQLRLCRLISGQHVLIEKLSFDPTGAIGKPFGIFEVGTNGKSLSAIDSSQKCSFPLKYQIECDNLNSNDINSENSSSIEQKHLLTDVDIATLKSEGISTEKLVSKLINDRSQFSKEKYLRKMTKKHSGKVLISRPNIRLICQSYYNKDPERTSHLRSLDQLGLLLQLSAVHPCGCNIFVYENTLGILASAVMERLDNQGNCILLHRGDWPQSIPCIDAMNYRDKENFLPLRITTLLQPDLLKDEEESDQQKT